MPEADVEGTVIAKYKLQLACVRLMKQVFDIMSMDLVGTNANNSATWMTSEMLQSITTATVIFATLCANPTDRDESTNQLQADQTRKSDKIKQQVLKVFGIVPVLKYENILSSEYWQLSASLVSFSPLPSQ
ncbi:hypothetical protein EON65_05875 [archaeon]|nr:MAG: hypothetical protein EON65_05875 [archaeon]